MLQWPGSLSSILQAITASICPATPGTRPQSLLGPAWCRRGRGFGWLTFRKPFTPCTAPEACKLLFLCPVPSPVTQGPRTEVLSARCSPPVYSIYLPSFFPHLSNLPSPFSRMSTETPAAGHSLSPSPAPLWSCPDLWANPVP